MKRWVCAVLVAVLMVVALAPVAAAAADPATCKHKFSGGKKTTYYNAVDAKNHLMVESVSAKVCKKCGFVEAQASKVETSQAHVFKGSKCKLCKLAKDTFVLTRTVSLGNGGVRSMKFPYKDSYFQGASSKLNKSLAKASSAMAAAAYDANMVKKLAEEMGFAIVGEQHNYTRTATKANNSFVAFTIAKKTIAIKGVQKEVVACFVRGTGQGGEWFGNFNIGTSGVKHEGFYDAAKDVIRELDGIVGANSLVWIVGHSRGAAVANIAAAELTNKIGADRVYAYTFACPNVTTTPVLAMKNVINFVYQGDFVGQVPLAAWGFGRNGRTVTLSSSSKNKKMASRFSKLWGYSFKGSVKKPAALASIQRAAPSIAAFYAKPAGDTYSVAQVFDAVAAYLAKDASAPSERTIVGMIEQSPLAGDAGLGQLMSNQDLLFYGHSPEMYLAWVDSGAY